MRFTKETAIYNDNAIDAAISDSMNAANDAHEAVLAAQAAIGELNEAIEAAKEYMLHVETANASRWSWFDFDRATPIEKKHITFVDGRIELGRSDSTVKSVIDNSSFTFRDRASDGELLGIRPNETNVTNLRAVNKMALGSVDSSKPDFEWQRRTDGGARFVVLPQAN